MGIKTACLYTLLMLLAYFWQIMKMVRSKKTQGVSIPGWAGFFVAVGLRISGLWLVVEQTNNITAIVLRIADIIVLFGMLGVILTAIYIRHFIEKEPIIRFTISKFARWRIIKKDLETIRSLWNKVPIRCILSLVFGTIF